MPEGTDGIHGMDTFVQDRDRPPSGGVASTNTAKVLKKYRDVERLPWAQGVGRSNRPAPTICFQSLTGDLNGAKVAHLLFHAGALAVQLFRFQILAT
jgi:hypothetical protein